MTIHDLKLRADYFDDVVAGRKRCELRVDDRHYEVGDVLELREWTLAGGYTGRSVRVEVTHVLRGYPALEEGYVVLSIWLLKEKEAKP